jgi:hypothetical protein
MLPLVGIPPYLKGIYEVSHHIFIEDHVVPQLFTTAIEAYEFMHKSHERVYCGDIR